MNWPMISPSCYGWTMPHMTGAMNMAKAAVNKSKAIRDYCAGHPRAKPKEVVDALAEKNVKVNAQIVSTVPYNMKKKRSGSGRGRRAAAQTATPARRAARNGRTAELFTTLVDAKKLSDRLGGIQRAKQALKLLEQLL